MNRAIFLTLLSLLAVVVWAQERMTAPGATGMNSDVNPLNLRPTDAQYLLNVNISSNPGMLMKRYGHVAYGTNAKQLSAAAALYDGLTKWKAIVGVGHNAKIDVGGFWQVDAADSSLDRIDSTVTLDDSTVGQFLHTANYGHSLTDSMLLWLTEYDGNHDFTACDVGLIHANQYSPPAILSAVTSEAVYDSVVDTIYIVLDSIVDTVIRCDWWHPLNICDTIIDTTVIPADTLIVTTKKVKVDTTAFSPHVGPLSPERPGVLRPFAINDVTGGNLTGLYQYAIAFKMPEDTRLFPDSTAAGGLVGPWVGEIGSSSMVVRITSGMGLLTCFTPSISHLIHDNPADSTPAIIYRRRVNEYDVFRPLDSILYRPGDTVIYLDNIADPLSLDVALHYEVILPQPGQPKGMVYADTNRLDADSAWSPNTAYLFAYSYLDTVAGVESPLSPYSRGRNSPDTAADGTIGLGYIAVPVTGGYDAIRIYRTTDGADSIFYAVEDIPIEDDYSAIMYVFVGKFADTSLELGAGVTDETGHVITRPPHIYPLTGTFTDIEFWDDRLWGIGDPEFPSRLYRTDDEGFSSWNPVSGMYSLDEDDNDILIALEKISVGSADALLAFKRRKTFIISGTTAPDVEFVDGRLWGTYGATDWDAGDDVSLTVLTNSVGAISKELVIKHRDAVYVTTNDLEIVRFMGTKIDTISQYIGNVLRDIMTDTVSEAIPYGKGDRQRLACISYSAADVNARVMISDNEVIYVNQNSGNGMAWNVESETWSLVKYTFPERPRGTFKYDTISTIDLFGNNNDLFYFDRLAKPFYLKTWGVYRDTGGSAVGGYKLTYRSPEYGDGMHQWWLRSLQFGYDADSGVVPTSMTCRVINEEGDTIATSAYTASAGGVKDATVGFGRHAAKSLSFEITTNADTNFVAIYDIRTDLVKVGRKRIR